VPDASETGVTSGGCGQCGHAYGPHVLAALAVSEVSGMEIPVSGLMFCPQCDCTATWAVSGHPVPPRPAPEELAAIRKAVIG
jgi:hypothetical protein